jgi:hypothetical protein
MEKLVQVGGVLPAWLTVKVLPAMAAEPDLAEVDAFCVQETVTEPEPDPLVGETLSQEPLPEADQPPPWQPEGEPVTLTD